MHLLDVLYLFDLVQHRDAITFTVAFDFDNLQGISDEKRVKQISRATQHICERQFGEYKKAQFGIATASGGSGLKVHRVLWAGVIVRLAEGGFAQTDSPAGESGGFLQL